MSRILTITTDFGHSLFVGIMKGVILSICQNATIVDIAHNIEKFNISQASFILSSSYSYFPQNSIHIAVVDPGVGSNRKSIVIKTDKYWFVGPDNGIFSFIKVENIKAIYEIIYKPKNLSSTFHGRDIFAPVAANIAKAPNNINKICQNINLKDTFTFDTYKQQEKREVIYIDDFGNIILNLKKDELVNYKNFTIEYKKQKFEKISQSYSDVVKGELLLLINSLGYVEIAMREGSAAKKLNAKIGDEYFIRSC